MEAQDQPSVYPSIRCLQSCLCICEMSIILMHWCQFELSPSVSAAADREDRAALCFFLQMWRHGFSCLSLVAPQVEAGGSILRGAASAIPCSGQRSLLQQNRLWTPHLDKNLPARRLADAAGGELTIKVFGRLLSVRETTSINKTYDGPYPTQILSRSITSSQKKSILVFRQHLEER